MSPFTPSARRGVAGAVATLWLVVVVILWVATLGLWYMATRAVGEAEAASETQKTACAEIEAQAAADREAFDALSAVVGYRPSPEARSDPGSSTRAARWTARRWPGRPSRARPPPPT